MSNYRCESCGSDHDLLTGDDVDLCRGCAEQLAREELQADNAALRAKVERLRARIYRASADGAIDLVECENCIALRERVAKLERVREALASGFAMKTHDLAMHESWVIDDVDEVRAALDAAKETNTDG